jgi:predicted permease
MGILGIVVGLVLLIACANVASVLVARAVMRRGETAVRRALGASRARLTRQLLTESVVLALPGGILGLAVAAGVLELLVRLPSAPMAGVSFATLDARVVAFTLVTTLVTGLVFGLLPALLVGRDEAVGGLAQASGRETRGVGRVRNGLTVLQIALSMTLLVGALLLVRTLHSLASVDLGFDPALLTVHSLPTDRQGYPDQESHRFAERLAEDVRGAPGIEATALTAVPPFGGSTISTLLRPDDEPEREPLRPLAMWVSAGFFEAMGQRVVRGRAFTPDELALEEDHDPTAVLVNETLARELFGDAPALGRRVTQPLYGGTIVSTIVGVVTDARVRSLDAREPIVYLPYRARWGGHVVLLVRSGRPVEEVRAVVQDAAGAIDPAIPLASSESLQSAFERATAEERLFATLLALTALLAASLAAVGLYGVVAHAVARRRREFGIRLAIGAAAERLMRRVVGGSLALGGLGVALGWGGSWLFSRLLESRLHGVDAFDPPTFLAAGALLLVLTGLASLSPALAATRVDPSEALRSE